MTTVIQGVATVCVLIGAVALTAGLVLGIGGLWGMWISRIFQRGRQDGYNQERLRLLQSAWWFSEDVPTMMLIQDMGAEGSDMLHIRENWRDRCRERDARSATASESSVA